MKELIYQTTKIFFAILIIISVAYAYKVLGTIIAITIASFFALIFVLGVLCRKYPFFFAGEKAKIEKKKIRRFLFFLGISTISTAFFVYTDIIMLGAFVPEKFVGFYTAAFAVATAIGSSINIGIILFPVFVKLKNTKLENTFRKSFYYSAILSFPCAFGLLLVAKPFLNIIYGAPYLQAAIPLYLFSFLIIESTFGFYSYLFMAKEKPQTITKFMMIAILMNIIFNYLAIKLFIANGIMYVIIGVAAATLVSRFFYNISLVAVAKKQFKISLEKRSITKPFISAMIMFFILFLFQKMTKLTWPLSIIEIIFAALIYFAFMYIIGGIRKEDLKLVKLLT